MACGCEFGIHCTHMDPQETSSASQSNEPKESKPEVETVTILSRAEDVDKNKDLAAFSYLYVMAFVVYFLKHKESAFIRFHAKQGMILCGLAFVCIFIPYVGKLLQLVVLVGVAAGFIAAAQGQWKDVPLVGPLSRGELTPRDAWKLIVSYVARVFHALRKSAPDAPPKKEPPSAPPPPPPPPSDATV